MSTMKHWTSLRLWKTKVKSEVTVAVITGGFAVVVAMIGKLSRDNRVDHGEVHKTLGRIEHKIDTHIEGHE